MQRKHDQSSEPEGGTEHNGGRTRTWNKDVDKHMHTGRKDGKEQDRYATDDGKA